MQVLVRISGTFYVVSCPRCGEPLRYVAKSECYGVIGAANGAVKGCKATCPACGARLTGFEQE